LIPKLSTVLEHALDLLESSDNWCQGTDAQKNVMVLLPSTSFLKDTIGLPDEVLKVAQEYRSQAACHPNDPEATTWCSQGVLIRSIYDLTGWHPSPHGEEYLTLLRRAMAFLADHIEPEWIDQKVGKLVGTAGCKCSICTDEKVKHARHVVVFNDDSETTFEDVRLLFKRALSTLQQ